MRKKYQKKGKKKWTAKREGDKGNRHREGKRRRPALRDRVTGGRP